MAGETVKLAVKNMVCNRCIRVAREELERAGYSLASVILGEITIIGTVSPDDKRRIAEVLSAAGFELIDDRRHALIERVKTLIIAKIYHSDGEELEKLLFSKYLADTMAMEYGYLSSLFSSVENITIEKYVILQKIERVKELLTYDQLTLSEIAYRLGYSSSQHLSNQFRKVTGRTPTEFKQLTKRIRRPLDDIKLTAENQNSL
ncbi:hypothetical protein MASR2M18_17110 [Ignavibacteria bacterium]|nr:helix-turn-helix transcriptional regulator [Bacteroidota bacterium]MCZ2131934.1 AraC family transcriptional regulator [Bacteroidota bacterium]